MKTIMTRTRSVSRAGIKKQTHKNELDEILNLIVKYRPHPNVDEAGIFFMRFFPQPGVSASDRQEKRTPFY